MRRTILVTAWLASTLAKSLLAAPVRDFSAETETTKPTKLWTEPTQYAEPIARLEQGLSLEVLNYSTTGSWIKVQTPSGREGWIPVRFTTLASRRAEPYRVAKRPKKGERLPASGSETPKASNLFAGAHLEYANQFSIGKAHGFGFGFTGGYFTNTWFAPGLWIGINRFQEKAADEFYKVKRTAYRYFLGPNAHIRHGVFALDFALGLDIVKTSFTIQDRYAGSSIRSKCGGTETNTSFGLNLRPSVLFPMGPRTLLQLYTAYGAGFHAKDSCVPDGKSSRPQQISFGVGINSPL